MFRTEKPWPAVYEVRVEPETEVFEGSLYDPFRVLADEERERAGMGTQTATGTPPPPSPS